MAPFLLGLGAGVAIAALTRLVETSRLAIGPLAFYGNGALIVPPIGAGLALFAIWSWALASARPRRDLLWPVLGLHLGVGGVALPSLPGLLFTGLLLVLPTAGVSYGVFWALSRRGGLPSATVRTLLVLLGMALMLPVPMVGVGLIVGPFLATAVAAPRRRLVLGGLLTLVMLVAIVGIPLLLSR